MACLRRAWATARLLEHTHALVEGSEIIRLANSWEPFRPTTSFTGWPRLSWSPRAAPVRSRMSPRSGEPYYAGSYVRGEGGTPGGLGLLLFRALRACLLRLRPGWGAEPKWDGSPDAEGAGG